MDCLVSLPEKGNLWGTAYVRPGQLRLGRVLQNELRVAAAKPPIWHLLHRNIQAAGGVTLVCHVNLRGQNEPTLNSRGRPSAYGQRIH